MEIINLLDICSFINLLIELNLLVLIKPIPLIHLLTS
jgi:hypothetical protein